MSAISRKSLTPLLSCCKRFSERKRTLAAWCTASQAFRSAPRSNWKSFSRWDNRAASNVNRSARKCDGCFSTISDKFKGGFMATTVAVATMKVAQISEPDAGEVRIRVQACGVCHSDVFVKEGLWAGVQYPRVPGHEVAGIIDEVGSNVSAWKKGQRVGV